MLRKVLARLLVVFWVILSGFDLVEDLELPNSVKIAASPASLLNTAPRLHALNNIVESADHKADSFACVFDLQPADVSVGSFAGSNRVSRLHKLHRVYLI